MRLGGRHRYLSCHVWNQPSSRLMRPSAMVHVEREVCGCGDLEMDVIGWRPKTRLRSDFGARAGSGPSLSSTPKYGLAISGVMTYNFIYSTRQYGTLLTIVKYNDMHCTLAFNHSFQLISFRNSHLARRRRLQLLHNVSSSHGHVGGANSHTGPAHV